MLHIKFQTSGQMVLKQKILKYFSMYFYGLNTGPPGAGHLATRDPHLAKHGKEPLGNATYQISSI